MTTPKNKITFILSKNRINSAGKCPVRCRITYLKKRFEFSTGLFIHPNQWYSKQQLAKPPNDENTYINNQLSLIKNKINQAFLLLQIQENDFTVEEIYNQFKGKPSKQNIGIIAYYNQYLLKYKELIGLEIKQSTWSKFNYINNDLKEFIKLRYKHIDILLKDLEYSFIKEFEFYLKTQKKQKQVTINKCLQRFKKVVKAAQDEKLIESNPFKEHKSKKVITNVVFLTKEELLKLERFQISQSRLKLVKDLFVFCCYTGLAYNEMSNLKLKHIIVGFDDNSWIEMIREKTSKQISIPLLNRSKEIIDKYLKPENDYIFPKISNQKFNSYLKEIADVVGIEKRLTHHTARKTFASTVLLYNDVPMEIVSELLGHSKITITQEYYAKVVKKKVSQEMIKLASKIEKF